MTLGRSKRIKALKAATKMTFEQAKACYVHRYTMEYVPQWAAKQASNGKFYAPHYRTDQEWFDNTKFPPENPLGPRVTDCYSTNATWPLGMWLDKPYTR